MIPSTFFLSEQYLESILNKTTIYRFTTRTIDLLKTNRSIEQKLIRQVKFTYVGRRKELLVYHLLTTEVNIKSDATIRNERFLKENIFAFGIVVIGVNDKGEIVKIYNLKEMQDHWNRKIKDLREDNAGYEFEAFVDIISDVLQDEVKTLFFLNSKNMFGLYFHGLFGKNDISKVPTERAVAIMELFDVEVTEEIWADNRKPEFIITAKKNSDKQQKIISKNDEIKKYEGRILYNNDSQLLDGFLEIKSKSKNIKYSVVWVG